MIRMKNKSRGKELTLKISNNYNVIIGTIDNKITKAVYIKLSAWGQPTSDDEQINYTSIIRKLNKSIRSHVYKSIDRKVFDGELTIIDLDIRESGISFTKRSFMSCELTLFQLDNHQINSEFMIETLSELSENLIESVFEDNEHFKFYKRKN